MNSPTEEAEFNDLTSQRLKGTIDISEATRRLNVIHEKILVVLGAFDSEGRVLPGSASVKKNTATSTLKTIAFSLLGAGSVVFLLGWWYYRTHDNDASIENQEIIYLFRETGIYLLIAGATSFVGYIIALVLKAIQK